MFSLRQMAFYFLSSSKIMGGRTQTAVKSPGLCPLPLRMYFPKRGVHTTRVTGDNFRLCMVMVDFGFVFIVMCIRKKKVAGI